MAVSERYSEGLEIVYGEFSLSVNCTQYLSGATCEKEQNETKTKPIKTRIRIESKVMVLHH